MYGMAIAPTPAEIFSRAVEEGERRLDQSMLELVSTSFIAGFTIVFGIAALGIVHSMVEPAFPELAPLGGALAFGLGLVFLIVGRAELFNENFFDPAAKAVDADSWMVGPFLRLLAVTFVLNLVGGIFFVVVLSVEGALPSGAPEALSTIAEEIVHRGHLAGFARAIVGGALVALLSFMLSAVNTVNSRITLSYVVGVLLALGPFEHVIVTVLHLVFGVLFGVNISLGTIAVETAVVTAGNVVGGLGLVTVTHVAQAIGARESEEGSGSGT